MENERIVLSRVTTPQGEMQLQQWRQLDAIGRPVYEIIFNGVFLMASYNEESARAAATHAIEPISPKMQDIKALIGGLGIGYTLESVLEEGGVQSVDVVEIEDHIITWAKRYFTELNGHALSDPRVNLIRDDVNTYIVNTKNHYDVIILDVDNGPMMLAMGCNQNLYETPMLTRIKALLTDGGVLTVWAEKECPPFRKRLEEVFGHAEVIVVHEEDRRGGQVPYFIYRTQSFKQDTAPRRMNRVPENFKRHGGNNSSGENTTYFTSDMS